MLIDYRQQIASLSPPIINVKIKGKAMLIKIECPKCHTEGSFSISQAVYDGPYRCWKCRGLFSIHIEQNELKSCEPLTEEEFAEQQEIEALKSKFKRD